MPKALIVYVSLTGCTEEMAFYLAEVLRQKNVEVLVEQGTQVYPKEFLEYDICMVGTYTYGAHGDLPDEMEDFYFDLPKIDLSGKVYGVFGSGDPIYDFYCKSVDDFDKQLSFANARRAGEVVKFKLNATEEDKKNINRLANDLVDAYKKQNK